MYLGSPAVSVKMEVPVKVSDKGTLDPGRPVALPLPLLRSAASRNKTSLIAAVAAAVAGSEAAAADAVSRAQAILAASKLGAAEGFSSAAEALRSAVEARIRPGRDVDGQAAGGDGVRAATAADADADTAAAGGAAAGAAGTAACAAGDDTCPNVAAGAAGAAAADGEAVPSAGDVTSEGASASEAGAAGEGADADAAGSVALQRDPPEPFEWSAKTILSFYNTSTQPAARAASFRPLLHADRNRSRCCPSAQACPHHIPPALQWRPLLHCFS